jgi:hypothetical protein
MQAANFIQFASKLALTLFIGSSALTLGVAQANPIAPAVQAKVDSFKKQLVEWAANPQVVAAAKESNAKGGIAGMNNAKWDELADTDATVTGLNQSAVGKQITKWEEGKGIEKLNLRDEKGNLVANSSSSGKPLLYNNSSRPPFQNGLKGAWAASEVKPDPTTQKKSVQIAAPVMDGGKAIGVLHSAVLAE